MKIVDFKVFNIQLKKHEKISFTDKYVTFSAKYRIIKLSCSVPVDVVPNAGFLEQAKIVLSIKLVTDGNRCLLSSSNKTNIPSVLSSSRSIKNGTMHCTYLYNIKDEISKFLIPMTFWLSKKSIFGISKSPIMLYHSISSFIKRFVENCRNFSFKKLMQICSNEFC